MTKAEYHKKYREENKERIAAGKIISSLRVELQYAGMRGETPEIPFLNKSE